MGAPADSDNVSAAAPMEAPFRDIKPHLSWANWHHYMPKYWHFSWCRSSGHTLDVSEWSSIMSDTTVPASWDTTLRQHPERAADARAGEFLAAGSVAHIGFEMD